MRFPIPGQWIITTSYANNPSEGTTDILYDLQNYLMVLTCSHCHYWPAWTDNWNIKRFCSVALKNHLLLSIIHHTVLQEGKLYFLFHRYFHLVGGFFFVVEVEKHLYLMCKDKTRFPPGKRGIKTEGKKSKQRQKIYIDGVLWLSLNKNN